MDRVNGANTVDIGGGRRGFRSQNAAAGIAGTEVTAKFMNDVQEEICKVIAEAGIELDPGSQQQLYEALLAISAPGYGNRSPWLPVISKTVSVPPNDAETGDTYCIPAGATGAWTGKSQDIAEWTGSTWRIFTAKDGHGISLPDGTVFIRIGGVYVEWLASRNWVEGRKTPIGQLNSLPWLPVKSITLAAPPANASEGDLYIVAAGANGAWTGKAGQIAEWSEASWKFSLPTDGHGVSLPDGRIFERIGSAYVEKVAMDVQSGRWNFAIAGGTANALTATLSPVPASLAAGLIILLKVVASNTGPTTLNLNALGAKAIINNSSGAALAGGELVPDRVVELIYDGAAWRLLSVSHEDFASAGSFGVAGSLGGVGTTNWTVPTGVTRVRVRCWGAGGGGGGSQSNPSAAAGGGGGGYCEGIYSVVPGQTIPVTAGAAGLGGAAGTANPGADGGSSSFGAYCTANGGGRGGAAPTNTYSSSAGAGGSTNSFGNVLNQSGVAGSNGINMGAAGLGGGGGSSFGSAGSHPTIGQSIGAISPGGGGGGGANGGAGSAGGGGVVVLEW